MDSIKSSIILEYSKVLTYFIEKMKNYQFKEMEKAKTPEGKRFCEGMITGLSDVLLILANVIESEEKKQISSLNDLLLQIREEVQYFHKSPYEDLEIPLNLDYFRYPNEYQHFKEHFNLLHESTFERRFRLEKEAANYHEGVEEVESSEAEELTEEPEEI